jgi:hypothetical protein
VAAAGDGLGVRRQRAGRWRELQGFCRTPPRPRPREALRAPPGAAWCDLARDAAICGRCGPRRSEAAPLTMGRDEWRGGPWLRRWKAAGGAGGLTRTGSLKAGSSSAGLQRLGLAPLDSMTGPGCRFGRRRARRFD